LRACLYCESAAGDLPQAMVYQDDHVVAFLDWRQSAPGHVLVVPRQHLSAEELFLSSAVGPALLRAVVRIARGLRRALSPDGLQMGAIIYPAAGLWRGSGVATPDPQHRAAVSEETAEDGHFHLHLLPRRCRDEVARIWPFGDDVETPRHLAELAARVREAVDAEVGSGAAG
jgi:diadenosine tetraphosphate (Ap4A) HIT family hydrolase